MYSQKDIISEWRKESEIETGTKFKNVNEYINSIIDFDVRVVAQNVADTRNELLKAKG